MPSVLWFNSCYVCGSGNGVARFNSCQSGVSLAAFVPRFWTGSWEMSSFSPVSLPVMDDKIQHTGCCWAPRYHRRPSKTSRAYLFPSGWATTTNGLFKAACQSMAKFCSFGNKFQKQIFFKPCPPWPQSVCPFKSNFLLACFKVKLELFMGFWSSDMLQLGLVLK